MSEELGQKYDSRTSGKVVFSKSTGHHPVTSVYFEPSALKWDFSYRDGIPDGRPSLSGIFYYNKDFFDKAPERPFGAGFRVQAVLEGYTLYAHIRFYVPGTTDVLLGEFLARDPRDVVASFEGKDVRLPGEWMVVHDDSLEKCLRETYGGRETPANALFYRSGPIGVPSFYLTADELGWEFLYGVHPPGELGLALAGILFYNEGFFDKEVSEPINADFLVEQRKVGKTRYVLVKFYKPGDKNELLGEFLAADSGNESKDLLNKRRDGQWKLLPGPDLEGELRRKYRNARDSEALLYKGGKDPLSKSFRFESYQLGWEFWDNTSIIGHRLPGSLFFDEAFFNEDPGPIKAVYCIERKRGVLGYYALIKFYAPGSRVDLWGEFIALDTANQAGEAGLLNKHRKGEWRRVAYNVFTATAVKEKDHTEITLSILGNVARMQCKETDKIYGDEFNVKGALTSKTTGNHGSFVRWYKDRAIFYEDDTAQDFTAFFFPEKPQNTIGSQDNLKMNATWKKEEEEEE